MCGAQQVAPVPPSQFLLTIPTIDAVSSRGHRLTYARTEKHPLCEDVAKKNNGKLSPPLHLRKQNIHIGGRYDTVLDPPPTKSPHPAAKQSVTRPGTGLASPEHTAMPPMASRIVSAALLTVFGFAYASQTPGIDSSAATTRTDDNPRPNVLVVVVDDLGWKDVGFHEPTFSTPNLDAMVAEGVELSTFYTAPTCTPSRAQLMTGRYSYRMGMQDSVLHSTEPRGVPLTETFMGEKLQAAGYGTAAVGKWHLGMHMPQYLPLERGFDDYYGILTGGGGHYAHMSVSQEFTPRGAAGKARTFTGPNIVEGSELAASKEDTGIHSTELYTKKAAEYVEAMSAKDDPWFLYLSYQVCFCAVLFWCEHKYMEAKMIEKK